MTVVPGLITALKCTESDGGYSFSWNSLPDNGSEAVSTYCYGHITGQNSDCPRNSYKCQENSRTAKENALQHGNSYFFYVYAVNSVERENCLTETVATVLGKQIVNFCILH